MFGDDRVLQLACVRAYNEWQLEFCAMAPDRLFGHAVIPATGVADAVAELEWALGRGYRGVLISTFPSGRVEPSIDDDPFWARAAEAGVPVALHIGSFHADGPVKVRRFEPDAVLPRAATSKAGANTVPLVARMIFSGLFERLPPPPRHDDDGAGAREPLGDRTADAGARAGHDRDAPVEPRAHRTTRSGTSTSR